MAPMVKRTTARPFADCGWPVVRTRLALVAIINLLIADQPQLSSVVVQAANFFQFHYTRSIAAEQLDDGIGELTSRRSLGAASVFAFLVRRFLIAVTVGEGIDIQSSGLDI
jgi:hypothetical protein